MDYTVSNMKTVIIVSLKGGTGKSTTTVQLAKALQRKGNKIGLLDVDVTAPTLHKALGMAELPRWGKDSVAEVVLPFQVDGLYGLTMASHFGENPAVLWDEPTLIHAMKQLVTGVVQWPELDYLLLDSPPSSSGFMQALYDYLPDLYGVVLVFQPTAIAAADFPRTINFLERKRVPIIGLVTNMGRCISPSGEEFWPFISPKVDLASICKKYGIAILGDIPLTPDERLIAAEFDEVANNFEKVRPRILEPNIAIKLYKDLKRRLLKVAVRSL